MTRSGRTGPIFFSGGAPRTHALLIAAALLATASLASSCRPPMGEPIPPVAPALPLPGGSPDHTLLLIGDAGAPALHGDPVMTALRAAGGDPTRTTVIFLGDNIYPSGLPPATSTSYERSHRRLDAQLDAAGDAAALLVAGNHDWGGWRFPLSRSWSDQAAIIRQGAYLDSVGGRRAALSPPAGCAGPALHTSDQRLTIVAIDTQWWLLAAAGSPPAPAPHDDPACAPRTLDEAAAALREMLQGIARQGRAAPPVIVVGHHPIESVGPHGSGGGSSQEAYSPAYTRFRMALRTAFTGAPPLLYAAGHDHLLQLFQGPGARYTAVSGAGSKKDPIRRGAPWLFARSAPGFMRLELWPEGGITLSILTVDGRAGAQVVFCRWLEPAEAEGRSCMQ